MSIETIRRFFCKICGFITEDQEEIKWIEKTGICPACSNGKSSSWESKNKDISVRW
jgi:rubrerythrin